MNQNLPLSNTVTLVAELREKLKVEYGLDDDDQTLADTLEGAFDLNEQIARIARDALRSEAMAAGIAMLIKDTMTRKARLEHRAEKLRGIVRWAMSESGTKKIPADDMTLSLSPARAPLLIDEDAELPDRLTRIKREPNKIAIREAIEAGEEVPGARLGNASMTLTIKRG